MPTHYDLFSAVDNLSTIESGGIKMLFFIPYLLGLLVGLVVYILTALSFYGIAKRRAIAKPWLAWIPIGQLWILGSISDQYQLHSHYKTTNRRKTLLIFQIILLVLFLMMLLFAVVTVLSALNAADQNQYYPFIDIWRPVRENMMGMVWLYLVLFAVCIGCIVVQYVALCDLFHSCNPENAVLFFVISICVPITLPFFVFSQHKKDLGMKPHPSFGNM